MAASHGNLPDFVQNRCYARFGWDCDVRAFCGARKIVYQGFSLLTANDDVVRHPLVADLAKRHGATSAQIVFRFAQSVGILPLTGTSDSGHMKQDLASTGIVLAPDGVRSIEALVG
jgi:diketogulonate reductase-like aldo/keto reductase